MHLCSFPFRAHGHSPRIVMKIPPPLQAPQTPSPHRMVSVCSLLEKGAWTAAAPTGLPGFTQLPLLDTHLPLPSCHGYMVWRCLAGSIYVLIYVGGQFSVTMPTQRSCLSWVGLCSITNSTCLETQMWWQMQVFELHGSCMLIVKCVQNLV